MRTKNKTDTMETPMKDPLNPIQIYINRNDAPADALSCSTVTEALEALFAYDSADPETVDILSAVPENIKLIIKHDDILRSTHNTVSLKGNHDIVRIFGLIVFCICMNSKFFKHRQKGK
mgnify:CR=1 FL=1